MWVRLLSGQCWVLSFVGIESGVMLWPVDRCLMTFMVIIPRLCGVFDGLYWKGWSLFALYADGLVMGEGVDFQAYDVGMIDLCYRPHPNLQSLDSIARAQQYQMVKVGYCKFFECQDLHGCFIEGDGGLCMREALNALHIWNPDRFIRMREWNSMFNVVFRRLILVEW